MTRFLKGLWSTQVKLERVVLKAVCHRVSDSSAVKYPSGEPDRTPLYVGLPSARGSEHRDRIFSLFS